MSLDPEGIVTFEAAGEKFTAVFGFRAMKTVETHFDLPFFQALQLAMPGLSPEDAGDPAKLAAAGASVRMSAIGVLFGAALLKHHPGLTEGDIDDLIDEIGITKASEVISASISSALAEGGDDAPANPPRPRKKTGLAS